MEQQTQPPEATGKVPDLVRELNRSMFLQWSHHPVTHMLLREFLPAWRAARGQQLLNAWIDGALTLTNEQVVRGQIMGCHFLENLTLEEIKAFYGLDS